jgi:ectoine hydroxylase-related dioxygenase (phytanoyl-CoA dioxygenase family)
LNAPFVESNEIINDSAALRCRADRDGYLFLRDVVDGKSILETRRDITAILQGVGWIQEGTDSFEAITTHPAILSGMEEFKPVYDEILKLESFQSLAHANIFFTLAEALLGPDVLLQPSNILRIIFPSDLDQTTPAHQDYVHIQGTPEVWTAWLPLGDCPRKLGGLSVLSGSHKSGIFPVTKASGTGGLRSETEAFGEDWVSSPFNLGDMLLFHSHTVHQGLPNLSGDRLRLSADFRYQKATDPVIHQVLTPHQGRLTWEDVYADWKSEEYQYHWKKIPLTTVTKVPWEVDKR